MKLGTFFARSPIFTIGEVRSYLERAGTVNPGTLENLLAYHVAEGHLSRVRRGLYVTVPPGISGCPAVDPFIVASRLAEDAIVAYHSALELAGVAYSMHGEVRYLTARRARAPSGGRKSSGCERPTARGCPFA
jgi:predicted transcriptional regulator of viral defense system